MPLDIQPPNYAALAALAGHREGNLGLSVPGALGLQALQQQQAARDAAERNTTARMGIQQQGQLGLLSNQLEQQKLAQQGQYQQGMLQNQQGQLGIQQQTADQMGQYQQGQLGIQQQQINQLGQFQSGELANKQQQNIVEYQKAQMEALAKMNKQTLQERGAFAAYGRLSLEQAKTPEQQRQIITETLSQAVSKGYISADEAKLAATLPTSQVKSLFDQQIIATGTASDFKAMMEANKPQTPAGTVEINDPVTGKPIYKSTPTTGDKTQLQEDIQDREKALQKLGVIRKDFNKDYLTYAGQLGLGASKEAEKLKGVPILGSGSDFVAQTLTGKDPKERAAYIQDATKYLNSVEQFFQTEYRKPITGAAAAVDELRDLRKSSISKDMSPSEMLGAIDAIVRNYTSESEFKKNVLKTGLDVSPGSSNNEGLRQHLQNLRNPDGSRQFSDEQINAKLGAK